MKRLEIKFEHCYGIKKLEKVFEFKNKTFSIYAPNGTMKTSFAKTFSDYSEEKDSKDLAFPDRKTIRDILFDDKKIEPQNIFVIKPYDRNYESKKISTLLANKKLKNIYDSIHADIDKEKNILEKELKKLAGFGKKQISIEDTIHSIFEKPFFDLIIQLEESIKESNNNPYEDIQYHNIFNDEVVKFLSTKEFQNNIKEYIDKYDELIKKSKYLKRNFNFHHAESVQKQLKTNNFFKAGHSVNLFDGSNSNKCESSDDLEKAIHQEKNNILNSPELQENFSKIDGKLTNANLRDFRDYLLEKKEILPELSNLPQFEEKLWISYFVNQKTQFLNLVEKYKNAKIKIEDILKQAREEETEWKGVVDIFNTRFVHLPFHLNIKNTDDVILKDKAPTVEFIFSDGDDKTVYENKDDLLKILSTGEQRALYVLNIIFEIEARRKEDNETLFIIDDIADSFDYKNKYAIVEYLKYISETEKFYMLILTHNFDFFRTVQSRAISSYNQCLIAVKNDTEIKLERAEYIKNPFIYDWKNKLTDDKKLISSIPFVRNIIEYTKGEEDENYLLLTSLLHSTSQTEKLTFKDLKKVFGETIEGLSFPPKNLDEKILDLMFKTADECLNASEGINLENKIVLSIVIRIKVEKFMQSKITDKPFLDKNQNQTWGLIKKYKEEFNNDHDVIKILDRANLITPSNIHINSFMYEPILDMGDAELRELYKLVKKELRYE